MNVMNRSADEDQYPNVIVPENIHHQEHVVNGIIEFEDELSQLQFMIDSQYWEEAMERVRTHPDEILPTRTEGGNGRALTALHLACESGDCPLPLIRMILERRPESAAMVDKDGNTALHSACSGFCAYDPYVIAHLLAAYPQAALMKETIDDSTPLHLLLVLGGNVNLLSVRMLLDVAYSSLATLPPTYITQVALCLSDPITSVSIAAKFPPLISEMIRKSATIDPLTFPKQMNAFLLLPLATTRNLDSTPVLDRDQPKLLLFKESKGQTPLHSACARGADTEVIRLLTDETKYPGARQAAHIRERKDRYPLFYAAVYGVPREGIQLLFDLNQSAVQHYESYKTLPLHITYITPHHSDADRSFELISGRNDSSAPIEQFFVVDTSAILFERYSHFLQLTYHNSYQCPPPGCSRFRLLHAAASLTAPPHFLHSAIRLYPWEVSEEDEEGLLPLQRAAMNKRLEGTDDRFYWLPAGCNGTALYRRVLPEERAKDNPITILLNSYPQAARRLDQAGRLPLHWAIETGKEWDEGIESLVKAAPLSLATRDNQRHMYPFMLAAESANVHLTFQLLLMNPMVIATAIVPSGPDNARGPSKVPRLGTM